MPTTYEPLATTTLGSAQTSVTFSSISSNYTDLVLVVNGKNTSAGNGYNFLQFNGDTGSNYSVTFIYGDGSSAASTRYSSQTEPFVFWFNTAVGTAIINIMNYANTTTNKTFLSRSNSGDYVSARVLLWRSTAAINSILISGTYQYETGTTFTLYGIKAA